MKALEQWLLKRRKASGQFAYEELFQSQGPLMAKDQLPLVFNLRFGTTDGAQPDDLRVRSGTGGLKTAFTNYFSSTHLYHIV